MGHRADSLNEENVNMPPANENEWTLPPLASVLAALRSRGVALPGGNLRVGAFGDSAELSRELLALILAGKKRGGACLRWSYEAEQETPPAVGDIEIVLDHRNEPVLITRVTQVDEKAFNQVSADFAAVEGEGDGSLEYWQQAHWQYFSRECARLGRVADQSMMVVCETFEIVEVLQRPPPGTHSPAGVP